MRKCDKKQNKNTENNNRIRLTLDKIIRLLHKYKINNK